MKALTCPQCGSLITHLVPHQPVAECDYCGARLIIDGRCSALGAFAVEVAKFRAPERLIHSREPIQPIFIGISGVVIFTLLLFAIVFFPK